MWKIRIVLFHAENSKKLTFCVLALDNLDPIAYNAINNKHNTFYTGGKYG